MSAEMSKIEGKVDTKSNVKVQFVHSPDSNQLNRLDSFPRRHLGPDSSQIKEMLEVLGLSSLEELAKKTVPPSILLGRELDMQASRTEAEVLQEIGQIAKKNRVFKSYLGLGFHDCHTPAVILRNILENPGWYTQYTPYQAEISQGRLEALVNFQTMICDLTAMEIANASLLDEGTAAAEAMMFAHRLKGSDEHNKFLVSGDCHHHVIEVVRARAEPLGIEIVVSPSSEFIKGDALGKGYFGCLLQYPATDGGIYDYREFVKMAHTTDALVIAVADLLSLALLTPPGEWGADVVVGNSQRFGVPLGFGGPHAAFFATKEDFKRELPGRIIGVSKDAHGKTAYRLALQTREQHIRRERATSNICTAQVLLAIIASMYAVYHGPKGLRAIALRVHELTAALASALARRGYKIRHRDFFDTLRVEVSPDAKKKILDKARGAEINLLSYSDNSIGISLNETTSEEDVLTLMSLFDQDSKSGSVNQDLKEMRQFLTNAEFDGAEFYVRKSSYLTHPVFNSYHSETEMLRYLNRLQSKDLSLTTSMIPLGSCTMKLNATAEMIPVTWPEFGKIHPFAPREQALGYLELFAGLEASLSEITGLPGISLQPNAGSQGEYAGLLVIRKYYQDRGDLGRNICLIPTSAHGTNPASAVMAGMQVVTVDCDDAGNVDLVDLQKKAAEYKGKVAALMITYPSTHGVYEESIKEICALMHAGGAQVYMDGANLNAQVGLCRPGDFGVDVCHMNLHKTFCIPHGGGGPGMGPIAVQSHLIPYMPVKLTASGAEGWDKEIGPVSSAPWGSASILPISWVYIKLMGAGGLKLATQTAILNANYIAKRLEPYFPVLYRGANGMVAHECILDLRNFKRTIGIDVSDVAKRLMDYGFHAPTVSFPVIETLMVEPTESESKAELDRFCDALISIREEIREVEEGRVDPKNNVLKNAPHTVGIVTSDSWSYPYSREKAAFPVAWLKEHKYWPTVGRIDNAYGDRNLFCSCP